MGHRAGLAGQRGSVQRPLRRMLAFHAKSPRAKTRRRSGAFQCVRQSAGMRGAHGPTARDGMVWGWLWRVGARPAGVWAARLPGAGLIQDQARDTRFGRFVSFARPAAAEPVLPESHSGSCDPSSLRARRPQARARGSPAPALSSSASGDEAVSLHRGSGRKAAMSDSSSFLRRLTEAPPQKHTACRRPRFPLFRDIRSGDRRSESRTGAGGGDETGADFGQGIEIVEKGLRDRPRNWGELKPRRGGRRCRLRMLSTQ